MASNRDELDAMNSYVQNRSAPAPGAPGEVIRKWELYKRQWDDWYRKVTSSWYVSDSDLANARSIRNALMQNQNSSTWPSKTNGKPRVGTTTVSRAGKGQTGKPQGKLPREDVLPPPTKKLSVPKDILGIPVGAPTVLGSLGGVAAGALVGGPIGAIIGLPAGFLGTGLFMKKPAPPPEPPGPPPAPPIKTKLPPKEEIKDWPKQDLAARAIEEQIRHDALEAKHTKEVNAAKARVRPGDTAAMEDIKRRDAAKRKALADMQEDIRRATEAARGGQAG